MITRIALGVIGLGLLGYGVYRYLSLGLPSDSTFGLVRWLAIGVIVHDLVIAPLVVAVGWLMGRLLPSRVLGPAQLMLSIAALTSAIGAVLVWREGTARSPSLALLEQDYSVNLAVVLAGQAVLVAVVLGVGVVRERKATNSRSA